MLVQSLPSPCEIGALIGSQDLPPSVLSSTDRQKAGLLQAWTPSVFMPFIEHLLFVLFCSPPYKQELTFLDRSFAQKRLEQRLVYNHHLH